MSASTLSIGSFRNTDEPGAATVDHWLVATAVRVRAQPVGAGGGANYD
jgi:hypothetical protein